MNSGVGRSACTLQKIIGVTADGGIGPQTLAAVAEHDTEQLITDMHGRRQAFYERLKTFEHFGKLTRRNEETLHQAIELCRGYKKNVNLSVGRGEKRSVKQGGGPHSKRPCQIQQGDRQQIKGASHRQGQARQQGCQTAQELLCQIQKLDWSQREGREA